MNIRSLTIEEICLWVVNQGEKAFRGRQIDEWLWKHQVAGFDEMKNIPLSLREKLRASFTIDKVAVSAQQISKDKTIKNAFKLHDGNIVEGVLIPTENRMTACISSQVGCSLSCKFCATGKLDRLRNLDHWEIFDQTAILATQAIDKYQIPLSNIVYMGMGEPLLNYANMLKSVEMITSSRGLGMSPQRITVSTAGIAKMIKRLGDDEVKFNLALSLHAANDQKRNEIMPINETNHLSALAEALLYFYRKTEIRVTLEYIVFNHFNDFPEDAEELASFARKVPSKINLIEYNSIGDGLFQKSEESRLDRFVQILEKKKLIVNVRRSRGKDIDAACGQLANKH